MISQIFLSLALLLFLAKIFGEIAERLKLSSLVGEILAGVVLGSVLKWVVPDPTLGFLASLGVMFLLFLTGLSTNFDEVKGYIYSGSVLAVLGGLLSAGLGFILGYIMLGNTLSAFFLGVAIISTSTAITVRALVDAGEFHSQPAKLLIAIDMADEVLAIVALSVTMIIASNGTLVVSNLVKLFLAILGFFLIVLTIGSKIANWFLSVFQGFHDEQIMLAIPLAVMFIIAFASEQVGIAAVTGAFLAGMAMNKSELTMPNIIPKVQTIGKGFLIPLFFAYSAIIVDINSLLTSYWLILGLVIVAVMGKLIGCGLCSALFGFRDREKFVIGIGMIPRGEYSIIITQIALTAGLISVQIYTAVIAFVIISILLTPILLRLSKKVF